MWSWSLTAFANSSTLFANVSTISSCLLVGDDGLFFCGAEEDAVSVLGITIFTGLVILNTTLELGNSLANSLLSGLRISFLFL